MVKDGIKRNIFLILGDILLICLGLLFPFFTQPIWFDILSKIRDAINAGDSGHLILAAASMCFLYALQSTFLFLGTMLILDRSGLRHRLKKTLILCSSMVVIVFLHITDSNIFKLPWEPVTTIFALVITLVLFDRIFGETKSVIQVSIVSIQVFFAFQWLNIMPLFNAYRVGESDISCSIKLAASYLQAASVLNFTGFAFFLPFITSAFITATLFISFSKNIHMMRVNYEKESEIQNMKAKALENRIYKEVKSLVHDLKTPLVTIRGLNSLLAIAKDQKKLGEYSDRIEGSITKMNEMISSFLYESSRQELRALDLVSYIRAQLPIDDDTIKIDISIAEDLPDIYVNKIRVARAVINILENAILVPYKEQYKHIMFIVKPTTDGLFIIIKDNGTGIKAEYLPHIWEIGFSTNNTSGLGLPFARQIIEDNKGWIKLESEWGKGTEVTIFLPSAGSAAENSASAEEYDISRFRGLVNDNEDGGE